MTVDLGTINWDTLVALATGALAITTGVLAKFTYSAVAEARVEDRRRRVEAQILDADPLDVDVVNEGLGYVDRQLHGNPRIKFQLTNVGDRPVLNITATLRADPHPSESPHVAAIPPAQYRRVTLSLANLVDYEDSATQKGESLKNDRAHLEVVSFGIMGQRVIQDYLVHLDRIVSTGFDPKVELVRCQVEPNLQTDGSADVDWREIRTAT